MPTGRCWVLTGLLILGSSGAAEAVFVKSLMERVDPEPFLDAEYFLDILGFSYPLEWQDIWRSSAAQTAAAYRINSASLDCCDLFLEQELPLHRELGGGFGFGFALVQRDDKERQELHHWLEIEKKFSRGLSVSFFGEPSFAKEDSDIGVGLRQELGRGLSVLARRTWVDFELNRRSTSGHSYEREPVSDRFGLEWAGAAQRAELSLDLDHPLRRAIPAEHKTFFHRRTAAAASWSYESGKNWDLRARYGYEFEKRGQIFDPDPGVSSFGYRRQVHWLDGAFALDGGATRWELGHRLMARAARGDNPSAYDRGVFYRRWESQPYARFRRGWGWLAGELASFLSFGENQRHYPGGLSPSSHEGIVEAKLGAGLDLLFPSSGRIGVYSTFDLDGLGSHPWDGGNIRAMFFF